MKLGDRVKHPILGEGILYQKGKYGWLVNYSNEDGVLVRGSQEKDLELIEHEQKTKRSPIKKDRVC